MQIFSSNERTPLTRQMVASRLGVSVRTVDRLIASGALRAHKIGHVVRVEPEEVQRFLARVATTA